MKTLVRSIIYFVGISSFLSSSFAQASAVEEICGRITYELVREGCNYDLEWDPCVGGERAYIQTGSAWLFNKEDYPIKGTSTEQDCGPKCVGNVTLHRPEALIGINEGQTVCLQVTTSNDGPHTVPQLVIQRVLSK